MPIDLVIWGMGGHARVVLDILRLQSQYHIAGFVADSAPPGDSDLFAHAPYLGGRDRLRSIYGSGCHHITIAIGDCLTRLQLADLAKQTGFLLASAIHPRAIVSHASVVGGGTVIAAGAVVNPGTRIGENVIVNTGATVDHDCVLEDGVHVGPGAHLAGSVVVRRATWIGIGAVVSNDIAIGSRSIIGAGSVLLHSLPDDVVAYGIPARVVRHLDREKDDASRA